jgi:hypothetical protein
MDGETLDLQELLGSPFVVLSGYRPPGSPLPFGDVAIGAPGVYVVERLDEPGTVRVRGDDVLLDAQPVGALVRRVRRQAFALQLLLADALGELEVRVAPVLWVRSSRLALRRVAAGVRLASTRDIRRRMGGGAPVLPTSAVRRLTALAETRLIPIRGLSA